MNPDSRDKLRRRVVTAAERTLERNGDVSAVEMFFGIGWLNPTLHERWRRGQAGSLEDVIPSNASRVAEAMHHLETWARAAGLEPRETAYVERSTERRPLRFSKSDDAELERQYRTHWVSPNLGEKKRERLAEKAARPPELVVVQPHNDDWKCHRCAGTGDLLIMQNEGPSCLPCAGLGGLEFLPAGDAGVTRRAKAASPTYAVVVRFSRAVSHQRRRDEWRGQPVRRSRRRYVRASLNAAGVMSSRARPKASLWVPSRSKAHDR